MLFGEHGVIKKAQTSNEKYKIAQAREKLELVLNTDAAVEKRTNPKYNQDDFLDELILSKVLDTKILDNIIITDGYAFELDRSVPKIGEYEVKESELIFPILVLASLRSIITMFFSVFIGRRKQLPKKALVWVSILPTGSLRGRKAISA